MKEANENSWLYVAQDNLWMAEVGIEKLHVREIELNAISVHMHQALEKAVKHQIEMSGEKFEPIHDFVKFFREHTDLRQKLPQVLEWNLAELSRWERSSRAAMGYTVPLRKIIAIYPALSEYIYKLIEDEKGAKDDKGARTEVKAEEAAEAVEVATSEFEETGDSSVKSLRKATKMLLQELRQDKD